MNGLVVRAAASGDLEQLAELYNHYVTTSPATFDLEPVSLESRRAWMNRYAAAGPHRLLVAEARDRLAGYAASGTFRDKPGYATSVETSVYVHPSHLGQGVGTQLYGALFSILQGETIHRAYAGIVLPNPASMALHVRFAFQPLGRYTEVGRKFDRYWDVLWLERRF